VFSLLDEAAHQFERRTIPQKERPEELLTSGAEANQGMQPRHVGSDGIQVAHARREMFPHPFIEPQIKTGRRLS
jgi:hypothetical protein